MSTVGPKDLLGGRGTWCCVDGVCITLLPMKELSLTDWAAYLKSTTTLLEDANLRLKATISYYGFDVNAQHRKIAGDAVSDDAKLARHVLLTDSIVLRGAMRAFAWMLPSVKISAYAPNDWHSASQWLQAFAPHDEEELGRALDTCFIRVGLEPLKKSA